MISELFSHDDREKRAKEPAGFRALLEIGGLDI